MRSSRKQGPAHKSQELSQSLLSSGNMNPIVGNSDFSNNNIGKSHRASAGSGAQYSDSEAARTDAATDQRALSEQMSAEGYRWDFCIVVPNPNHPEFRSTERDFEDFVDVAEVLERLHTAGLQTYQFTSSDGDEVLIKVRASLDCLRHEAERTEFKLKLDEAHLRDFVEDAEARIGETQFPGQNYSPYEYIYAPYNDEKRTVFESVAGLRHPFSSSARVKLIYTVVTGTDPHCCSLNLRLLRDGASRSVLAYFPLHDPEQRDELARSWFSWRVAPWEQPIDDVRDYLGEKVALYFEFTGHYTTWLVPLSAVGLLVALYMAVDAGIYGNLDTALQRGVVIPFYCIFVSIWAQLMLEYWKRKEARRAMEWGMPDFEEAQVQRPEFRGDGDELKPSIVDGSLQKYFPPAARSRIVAVSNAVLAAMILLVLGCVSAVFYLQFYFAQSDDDSERSGGGTGSSIISAVQIIVLNIIYTKIAIYRTDVENYRTDTEYDDALIAKLFCFSFVNSYASLYYVAFVKARIGAACQGACMVELAYQLTIVFATQMTVAKVTSYLSMKSSIIINQYKEYKEHEQAKKEHRVLLPPSSAELENLFNEYDPSLDVLQDYAQIVIQYGYVTLFVSANPLAPLLAYFSNWLEVRLDGWKLLYMTKRVMPMGAQDIGTWMTILQLISIAAVVTNAGILCFTMQILSFGDSSSALWVFIGFQYTILIAMGLFAYLVDDVPEEVAVQLKRQQYLAGRALLSAAALEAADSPLRLRPKQAHLDVEKLQICEHDDDFDATKAAAAGGGGVDPPPCSCLLDCLLGHACSCCSSKSSSSSS